MPRANLRVPSPQMLSFMHAQCGFFQQGYTLLQQLQPYMKKLASEVSRTGVGRRVGWHLTPC